MFGVFTRSYTTLPGKPAYPRIMLALIALALALMPAVASAHGKLASSSPAEGATAQDGLTTVTLNFSEDLSVDQSSAQLLKAGGSTVSGVTSAVNRADRKVMTLQVPALSEGKYEVKWHAVTEDDNGVTDGTFFFNVAAAAGTTQDTGSTRSTSEATPSANQPLPAAGGGIAATLATLALLAAAGFSLLAAGRALMRRAG